MLVVFFGSGAFACPTLKALVDNGHEIAAVVTRPDKPRGRGRGLASTPVTSLARKYCLPVFQPDDPNAQGTVENIRAIAPDIGVVVAYGHLLARELFAIPAHGILNVHASILPSFRGAAPVPHAILAGEDRVGVTVFQINEQFDEGDLLAMRDIPVGPADTAGTALESLAPIGAQLLVETLGTFEAGWVQKMPQGPELASRAPKFRKSDGRIDWRRSPPAIDRRVRAMQPWPLAYVNLPTLHGGNKSSVARRPRPLTLPPEQAHRAAEIEAKRAKRAAERASSASSESLAWVRANVLAVEPLPDFAEDVCPSRAAGWEERAFRYSPALRRVLEAPPPPPPAPPARLADSMKAAERRWPARESDLAGVILKADGKSGIVIRCGGGAVRLLRLQPENRSAMSAADFLRGTRVPVNVFVR